MVVEHQRELQAIRAEWDNVFRCLPADGDPKNLRAELKPVWKELPKCTADTPTMRTTTGAVGVSSQLENPTINPLTGCGRTTQEVAREAAAYRSYLRRKHSSSENPAVFQGDYLLLQLSSKPIFLARVVHDCFLDDALSPNLSFAVGATNLPKLVACLPLFFRTLSAYELAHIA